MHLRIHHQTDYHYAAGVSAAQHIAHLQPPDTPWQRCTAHRLDIGPLQAAVHSHLDAFGNHCAYWAMDALHHSLSVSAHSEVHTRLASAQDASPQADQPWEGARGYAQYRADRPGDAACAFVFASHHVPLQADCADYARPSFIAGRALDGAAIDLMQRMHRDFAYEAQSTDIYTPVAQVLAQRRGVCQDFAHLLLSCLRSLGLPARYVSGYMLSEPPPGQARLQGADASHAWVALYVPPLLAGGQGHWLELDPTNCRHGWGTPGPDYVRLAVGRDFADVSPLRGVLQGGEAHSLQVQVTVEPVFAV